MNKTLTEKIEGILGHEWDCEWICSAGAMKCSCGNTATTHNLLDLFQEEMEEAKKEGAREMAEKVKDWSDDYDDEIEDRAWNKLLHVLSPKIIKNNK